MKAIITGLTGLIGSAFYKNYRGQFKKIYQLGRTQADVDAEWIPYDLSSGEPLRLPEVDVLFHFAGQTSNYTAKQDVLNDLNVNVVGTINLLNALRKSSEKPFVVLAGTATEYGYTDKPVAINERESSHPITFYDISKLTAENYVLQYVRQGWLDGCVLRLCNVYGGSIENQSFDRGVIDKIFKIALDQKKINIYGSGEFYRDYIHIDDVVSAFFAAWKSRKKVTGEYFNVGSGVGLTVKEAFELVARLAEEITGDSVEVSFTSYPEQMSLIECRSFIANNKKFSEATRWTPKFTLEDGIRFSYSSLF